MNAEVPNMILQPLVENSIQHGISKKASVGLITIRGRRQSNRVLITIQDNGGGSGGDSNSVRFGIGLSNTQARLQQLYGLDFAFHLSTKADGTTVEIDIPFRFIEDPVREELPTPWRRYVS
jgi:LytS/YehU family sensor histidine kinase